MFNKIMHIAFYTDNWDEMLDFYTNKLGGKLKVLTKYGVYKDRPDRPNMYTIAQTDPERIFSAYIEMADDCFIELFPARENQKEHPQFNEYKGYSHYAFTCDDVYAKKEELATRGVVFDTEISKGPSETYQLWLHDPDGNKFEIMQYTENSIQIHGNVD